MTHVIDRVISYSILNDGGNVQSSIDRDLRIFSTIGMVVI